MLFSTKAAAQTKETGPKHSGASDHDILLGILSAVRDLVKIQKTRDDETFDPRTILIPNGSVAIIEESHTPRYWAVYVSGTSAAGAIVRVYREKLTTAPAVVGQEVVAMIPGEGFKFPARSQSITLASTGTVAAVVIVAPVGDAEFKKL